MYLYVANFRTMAVPSVAMDVYNHYFSHHDLTYFCQIRFLKPFMACPYQDQLSVVMEKAYGLGNFNASLFATEGIASVGPLLAPLSALVCGLVIALGNRVSAGLPPAFVLTSSAVLPQILLNVPLDDDAGHARRRGPFPALVCHAAHYLRMRLSRPTAALPDLR